MNLVTIMNYDWSKIEYLAMCYTWINQAKIWLSKKDTCFIFSNQTLPKVLLDFLETSETCQFKVCVRDGFRERLIFPASLYSPSKFEGMNVCYKTYLTTQINFPFVFIDADTAIVGPLDFLGQLIEEKTQEVICMDHERIPGITDKYPPFINSGVYIVNDPLKKVYNWDKIYDYGKKRGFTFYFKETGSKYSKSKVIPGTDQALLKSYLDYLDYDYHNIEFDNTYNSCAGLIKQFYKDELGRWRAKTRDKEVKIVHYWDCFKPWSNKVNCPIFKEVFNDKMLNTNHVMEETRERQPDNRTVQ